MREILNSSWREPAVGKRRKCFALTLPQNSVEQFSSSAPPALAPENPAYREEPMKNDPSIHASPQLNSQKKEMKKK